MKVELTESFIKDIERAPDQKLAGRALEIARAIEQVDSPLQIPNFKKLKGTRNAFRIRVGSHRIGIFLESNTVVFMRCLPRKDIDKVFP